jgi:hypothetical protein
MIGLSMYIFLPESVVNLVALRYSLLVFVDRMFILYISKNISNVRSTYAISAELFLSFGLMSSLDQLPHVLKQQLTAKAYRLHKGFKSQCSHTANIKSCNARNRAPV